MSCLQSRKDWSSINKSRSHFKSLELLVTTNTYLTTEYQSIMCTTCNTIFQVLVILKWFLVGCQGKTFFMAWIDVIIWVLRGNYYHIHLTGQVYGNCFIDFATVWLTVGLTKDSLLEIGHFWSCNKWGKSYFMFKPWMGHFWEASRWGFRLFESLILVLLACSSQSCLAEKLLLLLLSS